jgi:mRNA-degrading endonuclease RelE of RelBE toxin-antitoxin system
MDNIDKFLSKLSAKELDIVLYIMQKISKWDFVWLDYKKLKWEQNLYRVRKWKMRIIFRKVLEKWIIVNIDFRGSVYKS